jgi:hypothetical protein
MLALYSRSSFLSMIVLVIGRTPMAPDNNSPQHPQVIALLQRGLKAYAPDKNQAIRRLISAHRSLSQTTYKSYELVVGTSTNQVDNAYRLINPSCER